MTRRRIHRVATDPAAMTWLLEAKGVTKRFRDAVVLKGVDLQVAARECVCIIGPSGSGKSTLLRCLNRLEEPSSGKIWLDGAEVTGKAADLNLVRQQLGMVFQSFNLYADVFRCVPPLTLMFIFYFAFPLAGLPMSGLARPQPGPRRLFRGGVLDVHPVREQGTVGGGSLDRAWLRVGVCPRRPAAGHADRAAAAFPPLVLLILINAGLPHFGLRLPPLVSVISALLLSSSAYYAEVFRAGLLSVPQGLPEAARATGLGYVQIARHVRVPLAVRNVLPDLLSNTLDLVKLTSIAAVVTYVELTQAARVVQGLTFSPTPIIAAALLYFILLWPLARLVSRLERRSIV